jgi:hypothetical protein
MWKPSVNLYRATLPWRFNFMPAKFHFISDKCHFMNEPTAKLIAINILRTLAE